MLGGDQNLVFTFRNPALKSVYWHPWHRQACAGCKPHQWWLNWLLCSGLVKRGSNSILKVISRYLFESLLYRRFHNIFSLCLQSSIEKTRLMSLSVYMAVHWWLKSGQDVTKNDLKRYDADTNLAFLRHRNHFPWFSVGFFFENAMVIDFASFQASELFLRVT